MDIQTLISELVEEKTASTDNFLVEIKVAPGKIAVIIDHPKGVSIDDCVKINRFLHEQLDEEGLFNQYELEVGSPGIEEPLKLLRQYQKNLGRQVSVLTFDGRKQTGILLNADETGIGLETEKKVRIEGKSTIQKETNKIPFTHIKETRVKLSFD